MVEIWSSLLPTSRIRLRNPIPSDAEHIFKWRLQSKVRAHQPLNYISVEQIRADLMRYSENNLTDYSCERFQWIVETTGWPEPIGWYTLSIRSWEHQIAEIGYSVSETYQGQGYGSESMDLLLKKIFLETSLYRIEAKCSVDNIASFKLLEKFGFRREGLLQAYFMIRGKRVDHYLYSLLRPQFILRQ